MVLNTGMNCNIHIRSFTNTINSKQIFENVYNGCLLNYFKCFQFPQAAALDLKEQSLIQEINL